VALGRWELRSRLSEEAALPEHRDRHRKRVAARIMRILGVEIGVRGEVPMTRATRLVVANHRTAMDIGVLMSLFGGSFLSRSDLGEWPVVGRLAHHGETIFVDRDSKSSGARAIRAIRTHLKNGRSVTMFPEGTTYRGDEIRPFRRGGFVAARNLDVEVLPVALAYPHGVEYVDSGFLEHVGDVAARDRTPVAVRVGTPWRVAGTAAEMAARAEDEVRELVTLARRDFEERA